MEKKELEYAKMNLAAERFNTIIELIKYFIKYGSFLVALWLIFEGLEKILVGQNADGITAIAKVVEALKIGSIIGYVFGLGATVSWNKERIGKIRAIKEKNKYQKIAEQSQPNRTSSGLNEDGSTPAEE